MTIDELQERVRLHELSKHANYFMAVCLRGSMHGAADLLDITPRTVSNHINWLAELVGGKLIRHPAPGKPIQLTERGTLLKEQLEANYGKAIKVLAASKANAVMGGKLVEGLKNRLISRKQT